MTRGGTSTLSFRVGFAPPCSPVSVMTSPVTTLSHCPFLGRTPASIRLIPTSANRVSELTPKSNEPGEPETIQAEPFHAIVSIVMVFELDS